MILNSMSIYLFFGLLVTAYLATSLIHNSRTAYTKAMFVFCCLMIIYMFGYQMELNSNELQDALFWLRFQYIGLPFLNAAWLTICLLYTGKIQKAKAFSFIIIFIIPVITCFLSITNNYHNLYYASVSFINKNGFKLLLLEKGIWYYVQSVYILVTSLASLFILYSVYKRTKMSSHRKLIMMLTMSNITMLISLLVLIVNPFNFPLDYSVFFMPIIALILLKFTVKNNFLEIKSLGRDELFHKSQQGMLIININDIVVDYNKQAELIFKNMGFELGHKPLSFSINDNENSNMVTDSNDYRILYEDKRAIYWRIEKHTLTDGDGGCIGYVQNFINVSDSIKKQKYLERISKTDALSSLLNRREFFIQASLFLDNFDVEKPIFLVMLDIDHFKKVNDTFGHIIGDNVIKKIGSLLRSSFRQTDIIARYGGEEFIGMFQAPNQEDALTRAQSFVNQVAEISFISDHPDYTITISAGVACFQVGENLEHLITRADNALYKAKQNGRNQAVYSK